jgi:UDP-N-acetyl-D-mannosaminuronic acid dehydrogenase
MNGIIPAGSTQFIKCPPLSRRKVNDIMPVNMYNLSVEALKKIGKTLTRSKVAVMGWVFNSDDARNPPSEPYRDLLLDAGCEVMVHDPHVLEYPGVDISHELADVVKSADVVAILTGHDEYFGLDAGMLKGLMGVEHPVVVDGRNVVDVDGFIGAGFVYKGIWRGDKNEHQIH